MVDVEGLGQILERSAAIGGSALPRSECAVITMTGKAGVFVDPLQ